MLLRMTDINKFYNGNQVLSHVSLTVEDHDRIGLVGVNGCGKSTLLRILTEQELPDHLVEGDGEIARSAKTSIGYLEQMGGVGSGKAPSGRKCGACFVRCWKRRSECTSWEEAMQFR